MILIQEAMPGRMAPYSQKYCEILKENNIAYETIDSHDECFWEKIKNAELYLSFLWQSQHLLKQQLPFINVIDKVLKKSCFPDWNVSWHFEDKVSQYYLLQSNGFPVIKSHVFWYEENAIKWANNTGFPKIFKLKSGAGSVNVVKIKDKKQALKIISKMFKSGLANGRIPGANLLSVYRNNYREWLKNEMKYQLSRLHLRYAPYEDWTRQRGYVYFQDYLPDNQYDTRVTVIGDRAFGYIRYNRPNDFRSLGSGNFDVNPKLVNLQCVNTAFEVSRNFGFKTMAYDFLFDQQKQPRINEMCCQFVDWMVYSCPGYWDKDLNWHAGHYWPQYSQLCDLLGRQDLVQPKFDSSTKKRGLIKVKG